MGHEKRCTHDVMHGIVRGISFARKGLETPGRLMQRRSSMCAVARDDDMPFAPLPCLLSFFF
jgi:hypothetical protein